MSYDSPPPSYYESIMSESRNGLTFIDFLPVRRESKSIFSSPDYEDFRTVVNHANNWLQKNPVWEVKACESIKLPKLQNQASSDAIYLEQGKHQTSYIRGLRLWIAVSQIEKEAVRIEYMNVIPQEVVNGGIFSSPEYESLDSVIEKANALLKKQLKGRIISIESQEVKSTTSIIDPDLGFWTENNSSSYRFVFVIRIYYFVGNEFSEEIGIVDFVPEKLTEWGLIRVPEFEPFSSVVVKASRWCSQQFGIKIINVQSLEMKIKRGPINTQKMNYVKHGSTSTFYVRILRIAFVHSVHSQTSELLHLTCRTFAPVQVKRGLIPKYESVHDTRQRMEAWIKATGAHVINAETCAIRLYSGGERKYGSEATFTYNRPEQSEYWIFIFRLYMNGVYQEPPVYLLPPVPDIVGTDCILF